MSIVASDLSERLDTLTKLVLAEPVARIGHSRVTVRPLKLRGKAFFQLEYQQGQKVAHRNVARGALLETFEQELDGLFRSVTLCTETETRPVRPQDERRVQVHGPSPARPAPP